MVVSLLVVLVVAGLVALGVAFSRRRSRGIPDEHGVRRFFQYLLLLGLLVIAGSGTAGLLGRGLDAVLRDIASDPTSLAVDTAFTVVGLPLYVLMAVVTRRRLTDPDESASLGWRLYVTAATLTALGLATGSAYAVLTWAVGMTAWDSSAAAMLVVWGGAWAAHWLVDRRLSPAADFTVLRLLGSVAGLVVTAMALGVVVSDAVASVLGLGPSAEVAAVERPVLRGVLALVVGAPVWALYWLAPLRRYARNTLWLAHVLVVGVAGGLAVTLGAASLGLYDVLVWLVGDPRTSAVEHFGRLPQLVGAAAVGAIVWWYHRGVLAAGGETRRTEVRRVYEYLAAGVGLLAAATGLVLLVAAGLGAVAGAAGADLGSARPAGTVDTLLAAVTLLAVGAPVWGFCWRRVTAAVRRDPQAERSSRTRRVFVFVLFGMSAVAAVAALVVLGVLVLEDVFAGVLSAQSLADVRHAAGVLVVASAVGAFHWRVRGADAAFRATSPSLRRVLLVGPSDPAVVHAVEEGTGAHAELWRRRDDSTGTWAVEDLLPALTESGARDVVVLAGPDGVSVVPVERP